MNSSIEIEILLNLSFVILLGFLGSLVFIEFIHKVMRQLMRKLIRIIKVKLDQYGHQSNFTIAAGQKTITNIHYDCLERIFDFLDLESLLMVAQTCKRLQIAAAAKFADDWGNESIGMYAYMGNGGISTERNDGFTVIGWKLIFPFLRCFGAKITNLSVIDYDSGKTEETLSDHLERYINQYCAGSLVKFEILRDRKFSSKHFSKPFKNVEEFLIYDVHFGSELEYIVNWLPSLRSLTLRHITTYENSLAYIVNWLLSLLSLTFRRITANKNAVAINFPYLESLSLNVEAFTAENAKSLLHANPQLKTLEIENILTMGQLLDITNGNAFIKELTVSKIMDVDGVKIKRFQKEHPLTEKLCLGTYSHEIGADEALIFIRHLHSLKELKFLIREENRQAAESALNELDSKWKRRIVKDWRNYYKITLSC